MWLLVIFVWGMMGGIVGSHAVLYHICEDHYVIAAEADYLSQRLDQAIKELDCARKRIDKSEPYQIV